MDKNSAASDDQGNLGVLVGDVVRFSKTIGETDVYLFAGITGDFASNHVNEQSMREAGFRGRIAHGALLVGYMSACSTKMAEKAAQKSQAGIPLSLGFDRIRFLKAVYLGTTVHLEYEIKRLENAKRRAHAEITVRDDADDLVAIAHHIMQWTN